MSINIPHKTRDVITYPCFDLSKTFLANKVVGGSFYGNEYPE